VCPSYKKGKKDVHKQHRRKDLSPEEKEEMSFIYLNRGEGGGKTPVRERGKHIMASVVRPRGKEGKETSNGPHHFPLVLGVEGLKPHRDIPLQLS